MILDPTSVGDIMHTTDANWTGSDIDVTAHVGSDAGNVAGVALMVFNTYAGDREVGFRKKGSSDVAFYADQEDAHGFPVYVGVDSNDVFQCYAEVAADIEIYLLGYWLNGEAEFLDDCQAITPTGQGAYESKDLSGYFTGTVYGAMCVYKTTTASNSNLGVQDDAGPDRYGDLWNAAFHCSVVPATSEAIEVRAEWATDVIYVIGAITDSATITKFSQSHNFAAADTYEEIDLSANVPAGAVGAIYQIHDGTGVAAQAYQASYADGQSFELYPNERGKGYWVTAINPTNRKLWQKCSDAAQNSYFVAYLSEPSSGAVSVILQQIMD
jgi:hypothetical protein